VGEKIGRNDPCWCGSGKKYKKCHLNRNLQNPIASWEAEKELRKFYGVKYCSCPQVMKHQCTGRIVKAHTVSKSASLKSISRDSHVYGLNLSFASLDREQGRLVPELIGINKASTFTGFCDFHDKSLFSDFENKPFIASAKQVFLVGYRALARELYNKLSQSQTSKFYKDMDRGRSEEFQFSLQSFSLLHSVGVHVGVRDIEYHKDNFDRVLVSDDFDRVRACVFEFKEVIPIACSGSFYPEFDFKGRRLQDFSDLQNNLDHICFSVFSSDDRSFMVFTWLEDSDKTCISFISSLLDVSEDRIFSALIQFACAVFENIFFSPQWWESLSDDKRLNLTNLIMFGVNPFLNHQGCPYVSNDIDFGVVKVARRIILNCEQLSPCAPV